MPYPTTLSLAATYPTGGSGGHIDGAVVDPLGTAEDNRALRLRAPIVLDERFVAGQQFGARGTPMAVLIDVEGVICL